MIKKIIIIPLSVLLVFMGTPTVSAASFAPPPDISNRQKAHLNITSTGGGNDNTACSEVSGSILSGSSDIEKIYNYFTGKGLSPEQAAGIIGNIDVESGGDPENLQDPAGRTKEPANVEVGWGLIQWTPGKKIIGLLSTAGINSPPHTLEAQLELIWWHMNNVSPTGVQNMYAQFKNITDVSKATIEFEDKVEGAGVPNIDTRITRAKEALRRFGGGGSGSAPVDSTTSGSECGSNEGGVASANGFTFPLKTTQSALKNNSKGKWCYESKDNCHHDYEAADLMIPTGTTVIAAKPGRVVSTHSGNQHPNNITIKSDDGKGLNYYTHLGANTVTLRNGAEVSGGDVLGRVGTSDDAMGTDPHLHFDMLPPRYSYRPSCSGAGCSGYPFINVQPALIETFKQLPE